MQALLALSRTIDRINGTIGRAVAWLVVAAVIVSGGNALVRKVLATSSNSWLELQWWMFGAIVLLAAPWTLANNEHIRIDIVSSRLAQRARNIIELIGHVFFLMPVAAILMVTSWEFFRLSYAVNEQSSNAGGLPLWPAKFLIPLGAALLLAQAVSELIKRIAIMRGDMAEPPGSGEPHPAIAEMEATLPGRDR